MAILEVFPAAAIFLSLLLLLALAFAYDNTLGPLFLAVGNFFRGIRISIPRTGFGLSFAFVATALDGLDNHIREYLASAIRNLEWSWHKLVHWNAYAWQELSGAVADVAEGTERSLAHLVKVKIGQVVDALIATVLHRLAAAEAEIEVLKGRVDPRIGEAVRAAERAEKTAASAVAAIEADAAAIPGLVSGAEQGALSKIRQVKGSLAAALAAAIATTIPRIRGVEREAGALKTRVGQIARTLTPAGIAGLVAGAVIAHLRLGWLKCSNVDRTARALCGLDHDLLDAVLLGTTAIVGTVGLVEFAKAVQGVTVDASDAIHTFYGVS